MDKKEENNKLGLGEISTIRNILMGSQIDEYNDKISKLQLRLRASEEAYTSQLKELENQMNTRLQELEKKVDDRFNQLERMLLHNMNKLDMKHIKATQEDKKILSDILVEMSQRILKT